MHAIDAQASLAAPAFFSIEGFVGLIFLITLFIVLAGAFIAVGSSRLVRSVAGLAVCFTGLAGVYYFLLSPFVAMMQMLIYVGAVAIIIVFGIMMASPPQVEQTKKTPLLAGPAAGLVAVLMFVALSTLGLNTPWPQYQRQGGGDIKAMGTELLTTHTMVFELISIVLLLAIIGALVLARKGRN